MAQEPKEAPPVEVSLKYMAWNIKEISENIKKLVEIFNEKAHKGLSKHSQREIDF